MRGLAAASVSMDKVNVCVNSSAWGYRTGFRCIDGLTLKTATVSTAVPASDWFHQDITVPIMSDEWPYMVPGQLEIEAVATQEECRQRRPGQTSKPVAEVLCRRSWAQVLCCSCMLQCTYQHTLMIVSFAHSWYNTCMWLLFLPSTMSWKCEGQVQAAFKTEHPIKHNNTDISTVQATHSQSPIYRGISVLVLSLWHKISECNFVKVILTQACRRQFKWVCIHRDALLSSCKEHNWELVCALNLQNEVVVRLWCFSWIEMSHKKPTILTKTTIKQTH